MRLIPILSLLVVSPLAFSQVWEKRVAPGVVYRMEVEANPPRHIHSLRVNLNAPEIRLQPEVAGGKVFGAKEDKGREHLSSMMTRTQALGGINADFFPWTGDPLGAMISQGRFFSIPDPRRAVFGWGPSVAQFGKLSWSGKIQIPQLGEFPLEGVNQEPLENGLVVYTDTSALAVAKVPSTYFVCEFADTPVVFGPQTSATLAVTEVVKDLGFVELRPNQVVVCAKGTAATLLTSVSRGTPINLSWNTTGFDFSKIENAISGGPFLIKKGAVAIDSAEAGFGAPFTKDRHPRTALGMTASNELLMVVIDGRQTISVGASLPETAEIMKRLGCVEAINLDGGGSTTFALGNVVANRPSEGIERRIANALLLFGPATPATELDAFRLSSPPVATAAEPIQVKLFERDGKRVPNREIVWSAWGAGWVDQNGRVRAISAGKVQLRALCRGITVTAELTTDIPIPPPAQPKK